MTDTIKTAIMPTEQTPISFLTVGQLKGLISDSLLRVKVNDQSCEFPDVLNKKQCSAMTGFAINTINKLICNKKIPYYKCGGKVYFKRKEVFDWMLKDRRETANEFAEKRLKGVL
jgi:excisionase family DNA binding protein